MENQSRELEGTHTCYTKIEDKFELNMNVWAISTWNGRIIRRYAARKQGNKNHQSDHKKLMKARPTTHHGYSSEKKEEISLSKKQYASDLVTNIQETKNLKLLLIKFVLQWMQHFNVL